MEKKKRNFRVFGGLGLSGLRILLSYFWPAPLQRPEGKKKSAIFFFDHQWVQTPAKPRFIEIEIEKSRFLIEKNSTPNSGFGKGGSAFPAGGNPHTLVPPRKPIRPPGAPLLWDPGSAPSKSGPPGAPPPRWARIRPFQILILGSIFFSIKNRLFFNLDFDKTWFGGGLDPLVVEKKMRTLFFP